MTAIRPERLALDKSVPESMGPEKFAPDRRAPERLGEISLAAASAVEGEIREFVRRDVAFLAGSAMSRRPATIRRART